MKQAIKKAVKGMYAYLNKLINYKIWRKTERNGNTPHDLIFDVIKPNDGQKTAV